MKKFIAAISIIMLLGTNLFAQTISNLRATNLTQNSATINADINKGNAIFHLGSSFKISVNSDLSGSSWQSATADGDTLIYSNILNLTPGQDYYYTFYSQFLNAQHVVDTIYSDTTMFSILAISQSTNITITNISANSISANFTIGDGANRIVIAREGSEVNSDPVDFTNYTSNSTFGSGSEIGAGNYVINKGDISNFIVNGLSQGNTYYFKIYEYNGSGTSADYITTGFPAQGNPASATTLKGEPTVQSFDINFTNITATSVRVNFTRGNGDSVLVACKNGSTILATPTDGVQYTANSVFMQGDLLGTSSYIVYNGTQNYCDITGLEPAETYYFRAYEYNNSQTNTNYLTRDSINNPTYTVTLSALPTTQASNISFTNTTTNSADIEWTTGNGANRIAVLRESSLTEVLPQNGIEYTVGQTTGTGNNIVYVGNGSTMQLTNLNAETEYTLKVYEYNGSGSLTNYVTKDTTNNSNSFTTFAEGITEQAANLQFTNIQSTEITISWTVGENTQCIVLMKQGSQVDADPVNGISYQIYDIIDTDNYVVYNGTDTSVIITDLLPATLYSFKVYAYNGSGSSTNYLTTGFNQGTNPLSQSTIKDEPTLQANNIVASNITGQSLTLTWERGDAANNDGCIVVGRMSQAISNAPQNQIPYMANSAFGNGDELAELSGEFVLYNGQLNTVDITNLQPETEYHFRVYEYNNSSTNTVYLTSTATNNPNTALTTAQTPLSQTNNFLFSNITETQYDINFTRGNGDSVLVVAKAGSAVDFLPQNGQTYTANNQFGSGSQTGTDNFVVYNGIGNNFTLTGLTQATTYHLRAFEHNGTNTSKSYYFIDTTGNPASQATLDYEPVTQPSDIVFSDITGNDITVTWTNGSGNSRIVIAYKGTFYSATPVDGTTYDANPVFGQGSNINNHYVVYNGSENTVTVSGLQTSSEYTFAIFEYNNNNGTINYNAQLTGDNNLSVETTTGDIPTTQASNISISNIGLTSFTINFTRGSGDRSLVVMREGDQGVIENPHDSTLYTTSANWESKGSQLGTSGYYAIVNATTGSVNVFGLKESTPYWIQVFEYNNHPSYQRYNITTNGTNPVLASTLKDEPVNQDSNLVFSNIGTTRITVSWSNGDADNRILVVSPGTISSPTNGEYYEANSTYSGTDEQVVYNGPGNSVTVEGLSGATLYNFRVFAYNNSYEYSIYNTNLNDNNPISQSTTGPATWTGQTSTNWSVASNWQNSILPTINTLATIPNTTNKPVLSGDSTGIAESVIIEQGASVTITETASLTVTSNVTVNNGAYLALTDDNTELTIGGNLTLENSGSNNVGGQLVVTGNGSVSVNGTTTISKILPSSRKYLMSSPMASPALTPFFGHYVHYWDEPTRTWINKTSTSQLAVMEGINVGLESGENNLITFTGTLNNGTTSRSISSSNTTDSITHYGWHILGNPYPSAIDLGSSGLTLNNVDEVFYLWNGSSYDYYVTTLNEGSARYIPAMQGFFIHTSNSSGSIGFSNSMRVANTQSYYKNNTINPKIDLSISNGYHTSKTTVVFHENATQNFDSSYDALLIPGSNNNEKPHINLFDVNDPKTEMVLNTYGINYLDNISQSDLIIPLKLQITNLETITFEANTQNIPGNINIYLYDREVDTYTNLLTSNYNYNLSTSSSNRFSLVITPKTLSVNNTLLQTVNVFSNHKTIYITNGEQFSNGSKAEIIDISGRIIYSAPLNNCSSKTINIANAGTYIVRILNNQTIITKKVIIN